MWLWARVKGDPLHGASVRGQVPVEMDLGTWVDCVPSTVQQQGTNVLCVWIQLEVNQFWASRHCVWFGAAELLGGGIRFRKMLVSSLLCVQSLVSVSESLSHPKCSVWFVSESLSHPKYSVWFVFQSHFHTQSAVSGLCFRVTFTPKVQCLVCVSESLSHPKCSVWFVFQSHFHTQSAVSGLCFRVTSAPLLQVREGATATGR
jgi:hypothetical protein